MIRLLRIENLAVAKDIELELENGFSVLTGETGAGKSILIDGLSLALGERFSKDMIRPGESIARITAIFNDLSSVKDLLDEYGIEPDSEGEIEIRRTFSSDGKTTSKINSKSISVSFLKELGVRLVSINSQTENSMMGGHENYISSLDEYADTSELKNKYCVAYSDYVSAKKNLDDLRDSLRDKAMMTDILKYQIKEIDSVKLKDPDEEQKLERQRTRLKDAERISKYASIVMRALSQNEKGATATYMIEKAQMAVDNLAPVLEDASEISAKLESIRYDLIDIAEQVNDLIDPELEDPDAKLDLIESRLERISKLKRKYGSDISDIISFRNQAAEKLDKLESGDLAIKEAESLVDKSYIIAKNLADTLSDRRSKAAEHLSNEVLGILRYLDMPKARFEIIVKHRFDQNGKELLTSDGYDDVEFLFSANLGYPLQALSKVASGGELSRTILALKCSLSAKQSVPTLVFDEIDTGVSGATSERIGTKLKDLSNIVQVICVTHSPQVASIGDHHYLIKKINADGSPQSSVSLLGHNERVSEIARIIGGVKVTEKQLQAASEMIDKYYKN